MALFRLSKIAIQNSFGIYSAGDIIVCDYNSQTQLVETRLNNSILISGSTLVRSNVDDLSWSVVTTGYTSITEESGIFYLREFPFSASFPYHGVKKTEVGINQEGEVRDISLRFVSMIMPSSEASDGSITIEASGTNSPFKYYTTNPSDFVNDSSLDTGQDTGVFSNLVAGTYTFYAVGYGADNPRLDSTSITITLSLDETPDTTTYEPRWELIYNNLTGISKYKTEILERDYTGVVEVVTGTGSPYGHSARGDGNDVYDLSILSSEVNVNLLSTTVDQFKDIALADEKKYLVKRYKFNGVSYETQWTGFVTPSSYQDVLSTTPYPVSISANDRLGDLKGFKFFLGDNSSKNFVKGNVSQLSILHICLFKLSMGFGYRVACNIFAASHTNITTTSPLDQTYLNAETYINDDGTDSVFCDEVVKDILEIYGATLFSWNGYWYIVRQEEWLNETIKYVQYDNNLVNELVSSWNPRVDFLKSTETNRARFINGAQSRIFTQLYGKVNLTQKLDLLSDEGNLLPTLTSDNVEGDDFKGFNLIISSDFLGGGDNVTSALVNQNNAWSLGVNLGFRTRSYIETTGTVSYSELDQLDLDLNVNVYGYLSHFTRMVYYPPYAQLKWTLKLGSNWIGRSGTPSATEIINVEFIDIFNSDVSIKRVLNLSETIDDQKYILRVFPVVLEDYSIYLEASSVNTITVNVKPIPTTNLSVGARLSVMVDGIFLDSDMIFRNVHYYELKFGDGDDDDITITPNDQSSNAIERVYWQRVDGFNVPTAGVSVVDGEDITIPDEGIRSVTVFSDIKLSYKRNSEEKLDDEFISSSIGESKNNRELDYEIAQFDVPDFNNAEKLVQNFLKYEDLTPTSDWTKTGGTISKSIQSHLLDWLTKLSKRCRAKISGNFRTDGIDFEPINVLRDPSDSNRLYLPTGVQSNFKEQEYSGELLEVGSDEVIGDSAYSTGFKQDAFK